MKEPNLRRLEEEVAEFTEKFPDKDLDSIPESVWEKVKEGTKLADACAVYFEQKEKAKAAAQAVNEQNAANSSGKIAKAANNSVYTAKEVAQMTPAQIKEHYEDILKSMQSKGFYA